MQHWLLIASLIATGLFLAWTTYKAGLRFYTLAIGATGAGGYMLVGFDFYWVGFSLVACCGLLVLLSRKVMKAHKVGPFASLPNKPKS